MLMHLQATVDFDSFARALDRAGDDGHGLPPGRADAQQVPRQP